ARPGSPAGDARTERFRTGPFGRAADAESAFERPRALGSAGGENASALLEAGSGRASRERSLAAPAAAFARTGTRSAPRPLRLGPPFADDSAPSAALGLRIVEGSHRLGLDAEQAQDAAGLPGRSRLANQAGDAPDRVLGGRGAPPRPRRRGDGRRLALWTAAAASRVLVARSEAY
ncbi:MAG: hypothetical protein HY554_15105, partial [Elusimicrobia bacterium]|nr:hypothetical protein [Elusimicrobiota bacterium]